MIYFFPVVDALPDHIHFFHQIIKITSESNYLTPKPLKYDEANIILVVLLFVLWLTSNQDGGHMGL